MTFSTREGYTRLFQTGDAGLTAANDLAVRRALEAAGVVSSGRTVASICLCYWSAPGCRRFERIEHVSA